VLRLLPLLSIANSSPLTFLNHDIAYDIIMKILKLITNKTYIICLLWHLRGGAYETLTVRLKTVCTTNRNLATVGAGGFGFGGQGVPDIFVSTNV